MHAGAVNLVGEFGDPAAPLPDLAQGTRERSSMTQAHNQEQQPAQQVSKQQIDQPEGDSPSPAASSLVGEFNAEEATITQPSLFFPEAEVIQAPAVPIEPPNAESSLMESAPAYREYLQLTNHSQYTIACFISDLRLLSDFLGKDTPLGRVSLDDLNRWTRYLRFERGKRPPAPKSMARRATFLKNFFGWLASEAIIPENPAAAVVLSRPLPPLPALLTSQEIAHLEEAAAEDSRSHCLVLLLLRGGLKKEEIMGLQLHHFDLSNLAQPAVSIEFSEQAKQGKQRRVILPAEFSQAFQRYMSKYRPQGKVFACTDRNLNYILARAVRKAEIQKRVTLQLLRDMYAVHQLQQGVPLESLREKLGLSEEAWKESAEKYRKLNASA
jgi:integrase/recombinase XerD